jgi:hypothetical protein
MNKVDLKNVIGAEPFRPVILRLSNGVEYPVNEPRDVGMARNDKVLFYFGGDNWVMIDPESIVEIISRNGNKGGEYPPGDEN